MRDYNCSSYTLRCQVLFDSVYYYRYTYCRMKKADDYTVLNLRNMSKDVVAKLKAAAALEHKSLTAYVAELLQDHVHDLEKKGLLPKGR